MDSYESGQTVKVVYREKEHHNDRSVTIYMPEDEPDIFSRAREKFEVSTRFLEKKPSTKSTPKIYTLEEFEKLQAFYFIYQENYRAKYCIIFASNKKDARHEFAKRILLQPITILTKEEFDHQWLNIQNNINTN